MFRGRLTCQTLLARDRTVEYRNVRASKALDALLRS
jgi:hypothetical protein